MQPPANATLPPLSIAKIEAGLAEIGEEIARHQLRAKSDTLVSPLDGVIQAVEVDTEGQVIAQGGWVAEIVPDGAELFAEVRVPASKIGEIEPGFSGDLNLLTFDVSRFGAIGGTVVSVSPSSELVDGGEAAYLVRLQIDRDLPPSSVTFCGALACRWQRTSDWAARLYSNTSSNRCKQSATPPSQNYDRAPP